MTPFTKRFALISDSRQYSRSHGPSNCITSPWNCSLICSFEWSIDTAVNGLILWSIHALSDCGNTQITLTIQIANQMNSIIQLFAAIMILMILILIFILPPPAQDNTDWIILINNELKWRRSNQTNTTKCIVIFALNCWMHPMQSNRQVYCWRVSRSWIFWSHQYRQ